MPFNVRHLLLLALDEFARLHTQHLGLRGLASDGAIRLRERLAAEILASMNGDYSFGSYDIPTSTSLAILTLDSLGVGEGFVGAARCRLADILEPDGRSAAATVFYSTAVVPRDRFPPGALARMMLGERHGRFFWTGREVHAASLYFDEHRIIATSLAALALVGSTFEQETGRPTRVRVGHHCRYHCADHAEYIASHALPPYVGW